MSNTDFPVIDLTATGRNIRRLRVERGLTVKELQSYFGFQEPRAIYKWQRGECLPSVDNLYALGTLLGVPMDHILVPVPVSITVHTNKEQQAAACCCCFIGYSVAGRGPSGCGKDPSHSFHHFSAASGVCVRGTRRRDGREELTKLDQFRTVFR